ncbi:hypothetical protein LOZ80_19930 [Paenibacillus sp. HWE-109]|uniref:hypothetical protein n=1 Tax=Paenibacillus sp. HWE-109 TaxID=1306526 RepID=UPI001EDF3330|nr:hypothetical protein [Paenibacillus sp. HWE-109]UKS23914.1 hypothetical protein LOZ80_19930 [Paenibacillus sp. HWE-109]
MKGLSRTTKDLMDNIYKTPSLWGTFANKNEEKLRLIRLVGQSAEIAAVPYLIPLLLDCNADLRSTAVNAMESLLRNCRLEDLVWLDEHIRGFSPYLPSSRLEAWYKIKISDFKKVDRVLVYLCSLHPNGYIREKAVEELSQIRDGQELPYLLIRLNDWVETVRTQARMAVNERIISEYASEFINNLPLVIRLRTRNRVSHHHIVESVFGLLNLEESFPAVMNGLESSTFITKRMCYQIALGYQNSQQLLVLNKALKQSEPIIRLMACRVICDSKLLFPSYFNRLINDRYAPIRRITLTTLAEKNHIDAIPELQNSLVDPHISVREVSRFYLNSATEIDFANHYLDYLWGENTKSLATALIALGEVGGPEHVEILAEYASHVDIKIKRAGLRGLSLLNCEQFLELFYIALQSDNNGLTVEGYRGLRKKAHLIDSNRLLNILLKSPEIHVAKYVVRLFAIINKWDQLRCLLSALQMMNEDNIRVEIIAQLRKWISSFNRSVQAKPKTFKIEEVDKMLDRLQQDLGEKEVKKLKFLIR